MEPQGEDGEEVERLDCESEQWDPQDELESDTPEPNEPSQPQIEELATREADAEHGKAQDDARVRCEDQPPAKPDQGDQRLSEAEKLEEKLDPGVC